jgi:hypothetical protein
MRGRDAHGGEEPEEDVFAPFRPRRGRLVSLSFAVASVAVFGVIALLLPGPAQHGNWGPADRVFFAGLGVAIAVVLWRFATIRAVPTRDDLTVRNLFTTRRIAWREVVDLRFGGGDPWVTMELEDTETLAVMAIQKADGAYGRSEASRLAALVQALGPTVKSPDVTL